MKTEFCSHLGNSLPVLPQDSRFPIFHQKYCLKRKWFHILKRKGLQFREQISISTPWKGFPIVSKTKKGFHLDPRGKIATAYEEGHSRIDSRGMDPNFILETI